ncbi:MAG: transcriptional regulator [Myxococcales bacterium]|nr:transcriptional regulator [Myxococcales bacterium]
MRGPKHYRSLAEFEREEISPQMKMGWSLDDLYAEATFTPSRDDSFDEEGPEELDFDF